MERRSSFEMKVGIFVFIGIVIFTIIIFSIGDFYTIKKGYTINVLFNFANGIDIGAPVRFAGFEVGEVQNINIIYDRVSSRPMVELIVWLNEKTKINEDAMAYINTLGLLGEKYLEIMPGNPQSRVLKRGDSLTGRDPVSTEEISREVHTTLVKLSSTIDSINKIVGDEELQASLKGTITHCEQLGVSLKGLSDTTTELIEGIKKGQGTLGKLIFDDALYNELNEFVDDLKAHPWKLLYRPKEERRKK